MSAGNYYAFESTVADQNALNPAAWTNFGRGYGPPPMFEITTQFPYRKVRYALNWALYEGSAFGPGQEWIAYKDIHGLPWRTRQVRNMIAKLCHFYADHIYPGSLNRPDQPVMSGIEQNIMVDIPDGNEALYPAIQTLFDWWGWPDHLRMGIAQNAALGDIMYELVDDIERRKIMCEIVWPGYIKDVEVDGAGNLKEYTKEYPVEDERSREVYLYARRITTRSIQTFRNGELWDYVNDVKDGPLADTPNPYGFVPARWVRWNLNGSAYGEPAIYTAQAIYDQLCSLAALTGDRLQVYAESPLLVTGTMAAGSVSSALDDFYEFEEARPVEAQPISIAKLKILQAPENTHYEEPTIDMAQLEVRISAIEDGLYTQFPEVRFEDMLREMSQLTGPGAERAMLDVRTRYSAKASMMDRHTIALIGMGIAMGGMRYNDGTWQATADEQDTQFRKQQDVFAPFGLDSYGEGKLEFSFLNRSLVPETIEERIAVGVSKLDIGVPAMEVFTTDLGYPEATLRQWEADGLVVKGFFTGGAQTTPTDISLEALLRDTSDNLDQTATEPTGTSDVGLGLTL
jgi:hypothetical protein